MGGGSGGDGDAHCLLRPMFFFFPFWQIQLFVCVVVDARPPSNDSGADERFYALYELSPLLSLCELDKADLKAVCTQRQFFERLPVQLEVGGEQPPAVVADAPAQQ